jgi:rhodanese-related sulfurtransferase
MQIMYDLGFTEVKNLIGGIKGWKAENHKLIK